MWSRLQIASTALLIFLLLGSVWLLHGAKNTTAEEKIQQRYSDAFVVNVDARNMNEQGLLATRLLTPLMVHYPISNVLNIKEPHVIFYSQDGRMPWQLTSRYGQGRQGTEQIELWKDVTLAQAAGPKNKRTVMTTQVVTALSATKEAMNSLPVELRQSGTAVKSVGFKAFLKTSDIRLLSHVYVRHVPAASH